MPSKEQPVPPDSLQEPQPILVSHLFPPLLDSLLSLLEGLPADEWQQATACPGWTVHDLACHLLGGDVGILSRHRDQYRPQEAAIHSWQELVSLINRLNEEWVQATRRLSPRLLTTLLGLTGEQVTAYFSSLDPYALGEPVSWAGPQAAPVWLDVAREFTERWLHQQQIREATGAPSLTQPVFLSPVLATFTQALPQTYQAVDSPLGTTVAVEINGPAGGSWTVRREAEGWRLYSGRPPEPTAQIRLAQDTAWRLFTRGLPPERVDSLLEITGPAGLGMKIAQTVAIIA